MTSLDASATDPHAPGRASDAHPRLEAFNRAGVLAPADVHGATTLCRLSGESDPDVLLAAGLALRAPRFGHVCVELSGVQNTVVTDDDAELTVDDLDWPPDAAEWRDRLARSPLVSVRPRGTTIPDPDTDRPLTLVGDRLYLDRYWRYERRVAEVLRKRATRLHEQTDPAAVRAGLDRLLPPGEERPDRQRLAVASVFLRALTVISGGPGTGKTFTVARLLALVHELAGERVPRVAVAAPTGKAADRLSAALREAADQLDTTESVRRRLRALEASTIHRLLGWSPNPTRFAHDQHRQLPHELVVVDETSMVDLPLMSKLLSALRPSATLVLVGDPDQLASVEAGAVLADVVGPAGGEAALRFSPGARDALAAASGEQLDSAAPARAQGIDDAIVTLGAARRYDQRSGVGRLAAAIHRGAQDEAIAVLEAGHDDLLWIPDLPEAPDDTSLRPVRDAVVSTNALVVQAARQGDADTALQALDRVRVLCAHRHGPAGVSSWVPLVERWSSAGIAGFDPTAPWYPGRPLLVTQNEPQLRLFNGDVGVVVVDGDGVAAAFPGPDGVRLFGPSRLEHAETVHAMTIHKSQGSEFDHAVVVLPELESPILTRELLYTAITRARRQLTLIGRPDVVRAAVERPISRAAGLREALWGR